jgi:CHAT domain-containing protein/Tfp pilus assembly protein PilF
VAEEPNMNRFLARQLPIACLIWSGLFGSQGIALSQGINSSKCTPIQYRYPDIKKTSILAQAQSFSDPELNNLLERGRIEYKNGNFLNSIQIIEKMLTILDKQGDLENKARVLADLGNCYFKLSKYSRAREIFQQSLNISRQMSNMSGEASMLVNLGNISRSLGDYPQALKYFQQALQIFTKTDAPIGQAVALGNLGTISMLLGDYPDALKYYQQSFQVYHEKGSTYGEGQVLNNIGLVYVELGDYPLATYYFQESLKVKNKNIDFHGNGSTLTNLGTTLLLQGKYSEALKYHQQALEIFQKVGDLNSEGAVLANIGDVRQVIGKHSEALDSYQQALKIFRKVGDRRGEAMAITAIGSLHYQLRQLPMAIDYLQQSSNLNDNIRTNLQDKDKVSLLQTQINSYKLLSAAQLLSNRDSPDSLISIERGRARAFSDLLEQRIQANPVTSSNTLNFAQIQTLARSRQATIVSYSILPDFDSKTVFSLRATDYKGHKLLIHVINADGKLTSRESFLSKDITLDLLVKNSRSKLILSDKRRGGVENIALNNLKLGMQVRLKNDSSSTRRKIISIDPQQQLVTLQSLSQEPSAVNDVVKISEVFPAKPSDLQQLHQLLIEPIVDLLPTNPLTPVILIPDGALYEVPFAALEDSRGRYLVDLHTISIAPSLAVLAQTAKLKQRNTSSAATLSLVIGNPNSYSDTQQFPPLKFSEDEARDIAKLFPSQLLLGSAATESAVKRWLPQSRIAHFATHGLLDRNSGLNSAIVLTPSEGNRGMLTARDVLDLDLHADLVVLSACKTGQGKITGDGVIGLSRSFISAGAASVIVSLWSVDDKATSVLMTDFYRQWRSGKSKAQALRQAMLNTKAKYPDPYYWSSMSLYGEID